ncbi:DUF2865 domain-containing protein [Brucella pseudogrignonensis]|uniref:DUF2865 domain-containing protein n=1 Tax=Brucella pseudogrignonensis TaxID=419475 RepID=UPI001E4C25A4|nr:DUF2865 domain-containing protein [Brucella pseudogrignonensis]MCD4513872.1 DUF2865 domain-containing protein [Brucella pseudogrignonensis]
MLKIIVILAGLLIVLLPPVASAEACVRESAANDAASKMLQRQLSALRSIERARGCQAGDRSGFFNACREVAIKINEVQQQLGTTTKPNCALTRAREGGRLKVQRGPERVPPLAAAVKQASVRPADGAARTRRAPKNALQFCVRLSDGYYFPTPNSQYGQKGGADTALAQCRMICETEQMAVYVLKDHNDESADTVSVATGQSYAELPVAYNYHGSDAFQRCNWNGYVAKVRAHLFQRQQSKLLAKLEIPLPDKRPDLDSAAKAAPIYSDDKPMADRVLRSVGPNFMPDASRNATGRFPVSEEETGF